ncbi:hypothetical protein [Silvimonas iriomotensis]|uniref:Helix-turn-helix domain-containing protein n=1 Tax=Silvimonas iriomotensis TaxID=449662 RepID=A0ABQ2PD01_9NEIS|nr:hypothetical protein [Silvimonas iriomotensis]GGP23025.1 hypothetical protein GCM10010970_30250 [Silvimonas iriomotensis]
MMGTADRAIRGKKEAAKKMQGPRYWIPEEVLGSAGFCSLGASERALFLELVSQLRVTPHTSEICNNGELTTSPTRMKLRGLGSKATVRKAARRLEEVGLIQQTRKGGLHHRANLFALTYLPLNESAKLDFGAEGYQMHAYRKYQSHLKLVKSSS